MPSQGTRENKLRTKFLLFSKINKCFCVKTNSTRITKLHKNKGKQRKGSGCTNIIFLTNYLSFSWFPLAGDF